MDVRGKFYPRLRSSRRAALIGALAVTTFAALDSASAQAKTTTPTKSPQQREIEKECPVRTNTAKFGAPLKKPVTLQPAQQSSQRLVNFGTSRAPLVVRHVTIVSDKPLPASLEPDQINYEATTLARTGNTLETAEFAEPTFSPAYVSHDRRSMSFAICLDPTGVAAGKYIGSVTVGGPEGLGSASVGLTVNAKDKQLFTLSWLVALLAAGALLVLKDAAAAKKDDNHWGDAFGVPLSNPLWWAATVITLVTAFGALHNVYANDPAWGASGFTSLISLVGTATAAVGGHTILTTLGAMKSKPAGVQAGGGGGGGGGG